MTEKPFPTTTVLGLAVHVSREDGEHGKQWTISGPNTPSLKAQLKQWDVETPVIMDGATTVSMGAIQNAQSTHKKMATRILKELETAATQGR